MPKPLRSIGAKRSSEGSAWGHKAEGLPRIMATFLTVFLVGCSQPVSWPSTGVYLGYYSFGYETSRFTPANSREKWWLSGTPPCAELAHEITPGVTPIIYIEVRGELSRTGEYGHMAQYSRELTVKEVLSCRKIWPGESTNF
jgi:hypothetical protein